MYYIKIHKTLKYPLAFGLPAPKTRHPKWLQYLFMHKDVMYVYLFDKAMDGSLILHYVPESLMCNLVSQMVAYDVYIYI